MPVCWSRDKLLATFRRGHRAMGGGHTWAVSIIGGTIATALGGAVLYFLLPPQAPNRSTGAIYCTAGKGTCITNSNGQWHVLDAVCPAGQSLRFVSVEARNCHSITPVGFSGPLAVCPATCGE